MGKTYLMIPTPNLWSKGPGLEPGRCGFDSRLVHVYKD